MKSSYEEKGKKWIPQSFTTTHVYCRSDHFGHVQHKVFRLEDGEPVMRNARGFQAGNDAESYLRARGEGLPQQFISDETKQIVADAREGCEDCSQEDILAANIERSLASRQRVIDLKEGRINE